MDVITEFEKLGYTQEESEELAKLSELPVTVSTEYKEITDTKIAGMFRMTTEDVKEYSKNAIKILKRNDQHATAKAVEQAFASLIVLEQIRWERDIAISQLEELGLGFGQKIDGKYLTNEEYEALLEYKYMYEDLCR